MSPTVNAMTEVPVVPEPFFLGRLPLQQRSVDFASIEQSPLIAESVRMLRTTLQHRLAHSAGNAIQVTSASPGSGKSTLTILLARSFAQLGKRVLLVDADVRRPSIAGRFAVASSPGLIDVLVTRGLASSAICSTPLPTLSVLPAGTSSKAEQRELLANGAFSSLLEQWRSQYDLVLLDSAPLLEVADAVILSRQVDGTILVVREQHCHRSAVRDALLALDSAGGTLVGAVFVGSGTRGRYGYSYHDYYGAGAAAAEDAPAPPTA